MSIGRMLLAFGLFHAVHSGNAFLDVQNNDGDTALHIATEKKNEEIVSLLLEHGARTDIKNNDGLTPLDIAEKEGSIGVIALLLKNGNAINRKKTDGSTYFHAAIEAGNLNISSILLNKGAKINFQRHDGVTPLHIATEAKASNTIRWLLKHGARSDIKRKDGLTPFDLAIKGGNAWVIHLLTNPPKPTREGLDIDALDNNGDTALHIATRRKHEGIIDLLLEYGARTDIKNNDGLTPLGVAEKEGALGVIALLLEDGNAKNLTSSDGSTYFHEAIERRNLTISTMLLKKGADVNVQRDDGTTPLHIAIEAKAPGVVRWLLKNGACSDIKRHDGLTPLDLAKKIGKPWTIHLLRNLPKPTREGLDIDAQDNNGDTPIHLATEMKYESAINLLLEHGARTDIRNNAGLTPLDIAEKGGALGVIALLLEDGNAMNAKRSDGSTYFHTAIDEGNLTISKLLMRKGAYIDEQRMDGTTPLMIAVQRKDRVHVDWLLSLGVCPYDEDLRKRSAFDMAAEIGDQSILESLLQHSLKDLRCVSRSNLCRMLNLLTANEVLVESITESFVSYLIDSETDKSSLCVCNSTTVSFLQRDDLRSLVEECLAGSKMGASADISLYDILWEDLMEVVSHPGSDRVMEFLHFDHLRMEFPLDGSTINCRFQEKFGLREKGIKSFAFLISEYSQLSASELREKMLESGLKLSR